MPEQNGLQFPKGTPEIIIDEATKHIPEERVGYAYPLIEHVKSDLYIYSMVISKECTKYMITFYNNQNYDDNVIVTNIRIDFV